MNNFPDYSKLPEYKKLREEQKANGQIVNDEDLPPFIFDNFLSSEELLYIHDLIKNTPENKIVLKNWDGQANLNVEMDHPIFKSIQKRIEQFCSEAYGEELEIVNFSKITKYTSDFGYEVKLSPHYDSRALETFICDLQLLSNHKWNLVVEGKEYDLKDGQAILFNGTNQMHWRENKKIQLGEETFLIFVFLTHKKQRLFSNNNFKIMEKRKELLIKETQISPETIKIKNHKKTGVETRSPLTHKGRYGNIFTQDEIDLIYNTIDLNSSERTTQVKIYGQKVWFVDLPQKIKNRVTEQMKIIHNENLKLEEISFARYSKEYSEIPALTPHYDNMFTHPRVTLDVQLRGNIDWPIVVEDYAMTLGDNMAAAFSGTHQIHWRKPIEFKDEDFVEMLFCHFSLEDSLPITLEEKQKIESNMMRFSNDFAMKLMKENFKLGGQIAQKIVNSHSEHELTELMKENFWLKQSIEKHNNE
jgi:hypothetical protein